MPCPFIRGPAYGSPLDAIVTVYDAKGRNLVTGDDAPDTKDAAVTLAVPADGDYFLSIIDAHDRGGDVYHYVLELRRK